jgi:2',3'-cyclic-nucleotide 2'-phosphodiesterase/3'-nucleotidase
MPGYWGEALGEVDLLLAPDGPGGGWRVARSAARLRPVRAARPDPAVAAAAGPHHARALAHVRQPVARAARPLHSYFALLADSAAVRLVNAAQAAAVRAARPDIAAAEAEVPLLAAAAPLRAGGLHGPDSYTDVPAGPLLRRHLMDLQVYPNRLQVVALSGAELRLWLERAASVFATVPAGAADAPLLDPARAGYSFDVVAGVTYRIDPAAPPLAAAWEASAPLAGGPGGRIRDLACGGRPVRDGDRFRLATNGYRLGSHPAYAPLRARAEPVGGQSVRAALEAFVAAGGAERPLPPPGWALAPVPGATALYPTGPGARRYPPPEPPGAGLLARCGTDGAGFDLYRVDLARADLLDGDADLPPAERPPAAPMPGAGAAGGDDPGIA